MMRSLDVLATEAAPEKFIAEMLRTIGQHLHARGVLLWLRNQEDDSLRLHLVIEDDQQVAPDPEHPFVKDPQAWKRSLQEMLFTKGPVVCDDIEQDSRIGAEFREYLMNGCSGSGATCWSSSITRCKRSESSSWFRSHSKTPRACRCWPIVRSISAMNFSGAASVARTSRLRIITSTWLRASCSEVRKASSARSRSTAIRTRCVASSTRPKSWEVGLRGSR